MQYFPLFIDTQGLKVLVVGGGDVAARKLELLCRTQATVEVIAASACAEVALLAQTGRIVLHQRPVAEDDIQHCRLVYLATNDEPLNVRLAALARSRGILANVVDNPPNCDFITPSIVDRGRLVVAISTAGAAPVFARDIRARLESWLPPSLAPLFDYIADKRTLVQERLGSVPERRRFWERFFALNGDRFDAATDGHFEDAFGMLHAEGQLLLVDDETAPGLLPIAAMSLLQRLDVIETDQQIEGELAELCRRDASRRPVSGIAALEAELGRGRRILVYGNSALISALKAHFPSARHLRGGAL
ncbi:bifunctional precorrin-2 dehydrogenase/sirohydrochlorin ferrochelatase [Shewanella sp. JM162201]|uniref:precorrin-2 dehydrogenase n=1 Tax=Shewanella jiangmenensis TaxID=2837387 RepID=A0ABS5V8K0_9GAMM|nr:bifunctional precorrin-2 dehydrogenase/sirohydrochlorin ferrochelatase [Shewanella jiangmenensis]MBT1446303.1 bifunctional precorrin-2 dehydrogenase/sirohydrochlorin ferrochelatase [Shewanella jiangmenensis]